MNNDLKSALTPDDLAELKDALDEMTDTERHILTCLLELHPLERVLELIAGMGETDSTPVYRFADPDPYIKRTDAPTERTERSNHQIDENGRIRVKNISAYWIPKLTITEVVAGTIYTVTGSYEGNRSFLQKLERITAKNFSQKMEDTE